MATSLFDSAIFSKAYGDPEVARLLSDGAQIRAMLIFEGALAKVQGDLGVIPVEAGTAIHRASLEAEIDPGALAAGTAQSGVPVPALVAAFRAFMPEQDLAAFVHWGATSQDVMDTALVLRLRAVLDILDARMKSVIDALALQATAHRETVMIARTRSQMATPTTLGARIAGWGMPLIRQRARLAELRPRLLQVSLAGASGTLSAMGSDGPQVADNLAKALGLTQAEIPWHSARDGVVELAGLLSLITGSLGKAGQDMVLMMREPADGFRAGNGGGSSTMPHKRNPVAAEQLMHLARSNATGISAMHHAMLHGEERDGVAWSGEWQALPEMIAAAGLALLRMQELAQSIDVDKNAMAARVSENHGLVFAEACSFALSEYMPRPDAQALVKDATLQAIREEKALQGILSDQVSFEIDWAAVFDPARHTGAAAIFADRFVKAAQTL